MAQDALTAQAEIARLKFQLARYRRAEFGRSSEKLARETEQLELALETLETDQAERLATASPTVAAAVETAAETQKPARRALPEHLPKEDLRHPAPCSCPSCGGALRKISDEVTETLDYVPGRFKVVRHIREKLSCRVCDTVVAAPAPDHAIARGRHGVRQERRLFIQRPMSVGGPHDHQGMGSDQRYRFRISRARRPHPRRSDCLLHNLLDRSIAYHRHRDCGTCIWS